MHTVVGGTLPISYDGAKPLLDTFRLNEDWFSLKRVEKDFMHSVDLRRECVKGRNSVFTWGGDYPREDTEYLLELLVKLAQYFERQGYWSPGSQWRMMRISWDGAVKLDEVSPLGVTDVQTL